MTSIDKLVDAGLRQRLVKTLPEYEGIDPMSTKNVSPVPQGDGEKADWDRQVRIVLGLLATLYLVVGEDKVLHTMGAEINADDL